MMGRGNESRVLQGMIYIMALLLVLYYRGQLLLSKNRNKSFARQYNRRDVLFAADICRLSVDIPLISSVLFRVMMRYCVYSGAMYIMLIFGLC